MPFLLTFSIPSSTAQYAITFLTSSPDTAHEYVERGAKVLIVPDEDARVMGIRDLAPEVAEGYYKVRNRVWGWLYRYTEEVDKMRGLEREMGWERGEGVRRARENNVGTGLEVVEYMEDLDEETVYVAEPREEVVGEWMEGMEGERLRDPGTRGSRVRRVIARVFPRRVEGGLE